MKEDLKVYYEYIEIFEDWRLVGFYGSYYVDSGLGGLKKYWLSKVGIITSKYK